MGTTRISVCNKQQAHNLKGKSHKNRRAKLTEAAIHQAALADPCTKPLTDYQRAQFRPFILLKRKLRL